MKENKNIAQLESKVKTLKFKISKSKDKSEGNPATICFDIAIELVAGVCAGGFLGFYLDRFFGTKSILLAVFIILGFCGAIMSIVRRMGFFRK